MKMINFSLLDCAQDIVMHRDIKGRIMRVNPAFCHAFGGKPDDWKGRWFAIGAAPEQIGGDVEALAPISPLVERLRRFDSFAQTLHGAVCFEWQEATLADGSSLMIGRDISHRRAEEDTLRDQRAGLAAEARAREQLFATLTHEFRTPINGVLGMASLMRHAGPNPEQAAYIDAIETSGRHLLGLVNNILDAAQLAAGEVSMTMAPFSPGDVVQELAEFLAPKAREKGIDITAQIGAETPAEAMGDVTRLRQILFNLAGNAIKFTQAGGVTLMVDADGEGRLRFSVADTGPGIPQDSRDRIFEAFAQVNNTSAKRQEGAGLGLSIARKLAEAMGGRLDLICPPGGGSVFTATLVARTLKPPRPADFAGLHFVVAAPDWVATSLLAQLRAGGATGRQWKIGDAPEPNAVLLASLGLANSVPIGVEGYRAALVLAAPDERRQLPHVLTLGFDAWLISPWRLATLEVQINRALGRALPEQVAAVCPAMDARNAAEEPERIAARVLLVEDNPINALLSESVLKRIGATVTLATHGMMALELAGEDRFDLIFMDMRLPEMDGIAVTRALREASGPNARSPIVALTANATPADRAACLAAGMDDFLTKPVEPEEFRNILNRMVVRPAA
jgi:signal transduction histidine kinase/CheY-like chemotaxis protein